MKRVLASVVTFVGGRPAFAQDFWRSQENRNGWTRTTCGQLPTIEF